jgi:hypothetical protein
LSSSPRGGTGSPLGACGAAGRPALQPGSGHEALVIRLRLGLPVSDGAGHTSLLRGDHVALL